MSYSNIFLVTVLAFFSHKAFAQRSSQNLAPGEQLRLTIDLEFKSKKEFVDDCIKAQRQEITKLSSEREQKKALAKSASSCQTKMNEMLGNDENAVYHQFPGDSSQVGEDIEGTSRFCGLRLSPASGRIRLSKGKRLKITQNNTRDEELAQYRGSQVADYGAAVSAPEKNIQVLTNLNFDLNSGEGPDKLALRFTCSLDQKKLKPGLDALNSFPLAVDEKYNSDCEAWADLDERSGNLRMTQSRAAEHGAMVCQESFVKIGGNLKDFEKQMSKKCSSESLGEDEALRARCRLGEAHRIFNERLSQFNQKPIHSGTGGDR